MYTERWNKAVPSKRKNQTSEVSKNSMQKCTELLQLIAEIAETCENVLLFLKDSVIMVSSD